MERWFEVRVKYKKIDEQGNEKNASEAYLIDAISFTESEARINKVLEAYISGEFKITSMKPANYSEIVAAEDGEWYYKAKVSIVTLDESSGREKKANQYILVAADNIKQAIERLEESLSTMIVPWTIKSITESLIIDVFPFFEEENEKEEILENLKPVEKEEENE